jgi:general secretion pathway protein A
MMPASSSAAASFARVMARAREEYAMYEDYYGFVEKPFSLTPDPKYLFKSASHANAFELFHYAVRRREGFVVITGDIGTGKTTLCRAILEQVDRKTFTALVLNPFLSEEDLLRLILQDFGVVSRDEMRRGRLVGITKQELIETLNDFLLSLQPLGASALLIIDEAQNLPLQVLEQIRILSNLETDKEKLLQIVLVGQPNLKAHLRSIELRQLDQRVSIKYELMPLSPEETGAYVMHRLAIAGGGAAVSFAPAALARIHRCTGGIPRLINLACDRALLAAYSARTNRVLPAHVRHAADSLELEAPRRRVLSWMRQRFASFAAGAGFATVVSLAATSLSQSPVRIHSANRSTIVPSIVVPESKPVSPATLTRARIQPPLATILPAEPVAAPTTGKTPAVRMLKPIDTVPAEGRSYSVLVASFKMASEADFLATQLRDLGYPASVWRAGVPARGLWHQVIAGPFADLGAARAGEARLRQLPGYSDAHLLQR